jgi:hypothetical protein
VELVGLFPSNYVLYPIWEENTVELGYDVMKGTEYFMSLYTSVVLTGRYNVMINNDELIGTTEYLTLYTRCRINPMSL